MSNISNVFIKELSLEYVNFNVFGDCPVSSLNLVKKCNGLKDTTEFVFKHFFKCLTRSCIKVKKCSALRIFPGMASAMSCSGRTGAPSKSGNMGSARRLAGMPKEEEGEEEEEEEEEEEKEEEEEEEDAIAPDAWRPLTKR